MLGNTVDFIKPALIALTVIAKLHINIKIIVNGFLIVYLKRGA